MATIKKIGGTQFCLEGIASLKFEDFQKIYKGKLTSDIRIIWDSLIKECKIAGIPVSQSKKAYKDNSAE